MSAAIAAVLALGAAPAVAAKADCFRTETRNGIELRIYVGDRQCIDFPEPRTIEGVWINQFEGSVFVEGAQGIEEARPRWRERWFSVDGKTELPRGFAARRGHAYRLTLIGREAWKDNPPPLGGYGHMGVWPGFILADRIVEWEDLGPVSAG